MGEILFMMLMGLFVINGIECVIVLQLYCLFGVFFEYDKGKMYSLGKLLFLVWIILYCGLWFDFEFDLKDILYFCVDCCCKMLVMILLKVIGLMLEQIFVNFFVFDNFMLMDEGV